MIDAKLLPLLARLYTRPAAWLQAKSVSADAITVAGFAIGLVSVAALAMGEPVLALGFLGLNRVADGLDGMVARRAGATARGAFLDIAFDFFFYALFPLGFALADPTRNALPAAVLIAAFVGTGSSFLAFASIAARQGRMAADYPQKGIYYLGGLTEGAETIAVFAAMCLWPMAFPMLAYGFAAACLVTTLLRWHQGWVSFSTTPDPRPDPETE